MTSLRGNDMAPNGISPNPPMYRSDGVTLREYIDRLLCEVDKRYEQRFNAQEAATRAALTSAQMAIDKAEASAREWQRNSNEWRGTMDDKDKLLMTRPEYNSDHKSTVSRLDALETIRDIAMGKASQNAVVLALLGSVIGIVIGLIGLFGK